MLCGNRILFKSEISKLINRIEVHNVKKMRANRNNRNVW